VPKIPSYKILDVAEAIAPGCRTKVVGIRPGEKLHEEMITDTDSLNTIDIGNFYVILPSVSLNYAEEEYLSHYKAVKVPFGFRYNSETNAEWETVDSLRSLIKEHVDNSFESE
jgi:FlaA1/EpsC-like NDP-sugar epimerase